MGSDSTHISGLLDKRYLRNSNLCQSGCTIIVARFLKIEKSDGHVLKQGAWHDDQMTNDVGKAMFAKAGELEVPVGFMCFKVPVLPWVSQTCTYESLSKHFPTEYRGQQLWRQFMETIYNFETVGVLIDVPVFGLLEFRGWLITLPHLGAFRASCCTLMRLKSFAQSFHQQQF